MGTNTSRKYIQTKNTKSKFRLSLSTLNVERKTFYDPKHIYSIREYNKLPCYDYTDEQLYDK